MKKVNEFKEKFFDFTEKFASKTGDYAHITKLTMEIKSHETKIASLYERLGRHVYEDLSPESNITSDETVSDMRGEIDEHFRQIEERTNQINEIKNRVNDVDSAENQADNESTEESTDEKND